MVQFRRQSIRSMVLDQWITFSFHSPWFRDVNMIKLDYVTPGSPDNGVNLLKDNSGIVVCYHNAIAQQRRPIRLNISWKLSRDQPFYTIWSRK